MIRDMVYLNRKQEKSAKSLERTLQKPAESSKQTEQTDKKSARSLERTLQKVS